MSSLKEWFAREGRAFKGERRWDEPLSRHVYLRVGGPAELLAIPEGLDDLRLCFRAQAECSADVCVLGSGTNLIVPDSGLKGIVIKTAKMNLALQSLPMFEAPEVRIRVGASVSVSAFLRRASQEGWSGLAFLAGIPGSMGGVAVMNAGTHLGEAKEALEEVTVLGANGAPKAYRAAELRYRYRGNDFIQPGEVVWEMVFRAQKGDPFLIKQELTALAERRKATQPLEFPSCGSVFKNPLEHGKKAWEVVDALGLRGYRYGGAQVSEKHSNWILNTGGARASDFVAIIDLIKRRSREELGIELKEEVRIIHEDSIK